MVRRTFFNAAAFTAVSYSKVLGANGRIRLGIIGCGNQGKNVFRDMLEQPDVEGVAVCDVYQPYVDRGLGMARGARPFRDFRRLLEMKDLDAVIIATPDHWHALQTIMSCQAGKDVYVEKPLSLTVREGRLMVEAARKYNRVVQTGSQQRSGSHYAQAVEMIRAGRLGKVHHIMAGHIRNVLPGFHKPDLSPQPVPPELDYDMWLGPAPAVPYHPFRVLYSFRWFWDYSGGQMTNWGAHELDIARWALNADAPLAVSAMGGRYAVNDGGQTPDLQEVLYEFPGAVVTWSVRELNAMGRGGLEFHGTEGNLRLHRRGFEIIPEKWTNAPDKDRPRIEAGQFPGGELSKTHARNFLDCVKSRKRPNADVEEGHRTATMCHLGNIATRLGRTLRWDAAREQVVNDAEANRLLDKQYRKPWTLRV